VDWYQTIFELIDMRSFSNLWYWIALAVLWSTVSHWVLGVPFDMVQRARRHKGQALTDLEDMVRINVNRLLYISETGGLLIAAFGSAALTALAILGWWYLVELAQAIFLLVFPMIFVALLTLRAARIIRRQDATGDDLFRVLSRHRFWTQLVGVMAIFVAALWGMYQNMAVGPLGG
jgi:hypothetical protein